MERGLMRYKIAYWICKKAKLRFMSELQQHLNNISDEHLLVIFEDTVGSSGRLMCIRDRYFAGFCNFSFFDSHYD